MKHYYYGPLDQRRAARRTVDSEAELAVQYGQDKRIVPYLLRQAEPFFPDSFSDNGGNTYGYGSVRF